MARKQWPRRLVLLDNQRRPYPALPRPVGRRHTSSGRPGRAALAPRRNTDFRPQPPRTRLRHLSRRGAPARPPIAAFLCTRPRTDLDLRQQRFHLAQTARDARWRAHRRRLLRTRTCARPDLSRTAPLLCRPRLPRSDASQRRRRANRRLRRRHAILPPLSRPAHCPYHRRRCKLASRTRLAL